MPVPAVLNDESGPAITLQAHHLVGLLIFTISSIGFCGNLVVAIFTRKLPSMNNPFGKLMASQATGEVMLCGVFAFYFSPMVFFKIHDMEVNSRHAGWINLIAYDICIWSHLFVAINRLCAICFPLEYDKIFRRENVRVLIVISWAIPIITAIVLYKLYDCDLYFSPAFYAFVFTQNEVCGFISWNIDFYKDLSIVIVIAIVDAITITMVHVTAKRIQSTNTQQYQRIKREINFLKQAVAQGVVFVVELFTYFYLAWQFNNRWYTFALTTVAWNMVHTTDGMIILFFNREFRRFLLKPLQKIRELYTKHYAVTQLSVSGHHDISSRRRSGTNSTR